MIHFNNPIITDWHINEFGEKVSVEILNETHQIVQNKIVLDQLPDEQYRLNITGYVEINIKDKITEINQFKVDYKKSGVVYFHESLDGQFINIDKYYGKGVICYPASRVYTKINLDGKVIETMDGAFDVLDTQSNDINSLKSVRIHQGVTEPTDTRFWIRPRT